MVPDGRLVPELFDKWWSNQDHTSWFFNIRPNAKWSDGTPVTSDDFIFTLRISIMPENDYSKVGPLIKSIEKVNATLTKIELKEPNTVFDVTLGTAFYYAQALPEKIWGKLENVMQFDNFGTNVADGPFFVSNYHAGDTTIELLPNEFYWEGPPLLSKVEATIVSDTSTIPLLLLGGKIDAAQIEAQQVAPLLSRPELAFNIEHFLSAEILIYNVTSYPYTELDFRQALAYAIDRESLVRLSVSAFGNPGSPGYIPPNKGDWYEPDIPQYTYNPDKARELLGNVFMKGEDGFWRLKDGAPFQPKIYAPSEVTTSILSAQSIERMLREVGLDARATVINYGTLQSLAESNMGMHMIVGDMRGQMLPYVPPTLTVGWNFRPYIVFLPGAANIGTVGLWPQSANATFYDTVSKMNTSPDMKTTQFYARQAQKQIAENLPLVTLFYYDSIWAHRTDTLQGWPSPETYIDFSLNILNATTLVSLHAPTATQTTTMAPPGGQIEPVLVGLVVALVLIAVVSAYALSKRARRIKQAKS